MNLEHYETRTIADHWLCALFNGDETGLSDIESDQLAEWERSLPAGYALDTKGEQGHFAIDEISGLLAMCFDVDVYAPAD